jgi:hypothetical protein
MTNELQSNKIESGCSLIQPKECWTEFRTTFSCAMMQSRTGKIRMYIHTAIASTAFVKKVRELKSVGSKRDCRPSSPPSVQPKKKRGQRRLAFSY